MIPFFKFKSGLSFFLFVFSLTMGVAQDYVLFTITDFPAYTPQDDDLYLTGTFNNWELADSTYRFKKHKDGTYKLHLKVNGVESFNYKVNRGDWETVEGNDIGGYLPDHAFVYDENIFEHNLIIRSWQDLHNIYFPPIVLKIVSIPANTPKDAKIYVGGSFNGWNSSDPEYELKKTKEGYYITEINSGLESFEYKFSRGSWDESEARWDGGVRSNRVYNSHNNSQTTYKTQIFAWEDLSRALDVWKIIYIILLIQGAIALYILYSFKEVRSLFVMVILLEVAFLLRLLYNTSISINFLPQSQLLTSGLLAFLSLFLYVSIKRMHDKKASLFEPGFIFAFLPIIVIGYMWRIPHDEFRLRVLTNEYSRIIFAIYSYSLVLNLFYFNKALRFIKRTKLRLPIIVQKLLYGVRLVIVIAVLMLVGSFVALQFGGEIKTLGDWFENLIWIMLGMLIIYVQLLFLTEAQSIINYHQGDRNITSGSNEHLAGLLDRLKHFMEEKEVYTNPQLSLSDVAKLLGTNTYYVSKLINEYFSISFTDYINGYRIKDFIERVQSNSENGKPYLFTAHVVGFNSKSAFNRAFKKATKQTPSEYFHQNKAHS